MKPFVRFGFSDRRTDEVGADNKEFGGRKEGEEEWPPTTDGGRSTSVERDSVR